MKRKSSWGIPGSAKPASSASQVLWTLALLLLLPALVLSQAAQPNTSLVVTGQSGSIKVLQVQGRNYIEVDALARLINGSVSYNTSQIVLTLPGAAAADNSWPSTSEQTGFSRTFLTAGIEDMARTREWHSALKTAIERGVPLTTDWLSAYRAKAQESLGLASVAASTESDKNANQLLLNVFNKMNDLTDKYVQLTNSQTYFAPNSLQADSLDQSIVACGRSLAAMAAARQFIDDGSCQ
jgi:hypothetical protein